MELAVYNISGKKTTKKVKLNKKVFGVISLELQINIFIAF